MGKSAAASGFIALGLAAGAAGTQPERPLAYLAVDKGIWQIWVAKLDGSNPKVLTKSAFDKTGISWFPDGTRLLANGTAGEMVIVTVRSGAEEPLKFPHDHGADASVSPDGTSLTFSARNISSPDTNDIWVSRIDGSQASKIASLPALQHEPVWSPDGKTIYFLSGRGAQTHDMYRVSVDGRNLEQLTSAQLYHFDIAASAEGAIAFSSNRNGDYDVWIRDAAGKERVLVGGPEFEAQPEWMADGASIVFTRNSEGVPNLWRINLDGTGERPITRTRTGARNASVWRAPGGSR